MVTQEQQVFNSRKKLVIRHPNLDAPIYLEKPKNTHTVRISKKKKKCSTGKKPTLPSNQQSQFSYSLPYFHGGGFVLPCIFVLSNAGAILVLRPTDPVISERPEIVILLAELLKLDLALGLKTAACPCRSPCTCPRPPIFSFSGTVDILLAWPTLNVTEVLLSGLG